MIFPRSSLGWDFPLAVVLISSYQPREKREELELFLLYVHPGWILCTEIRISRVPGSLGLWDQSPAALPALPMSPSATTPKPCRDGDCWAAWTDEHSLILCSPPALYDLFQSHPAHVPGTTLLIHFPLPTTLALFSPGKTRLLYPASQLYFISLFTISVIPFVMPGVLLLLRNLESSSELCCLSSGAWQGWHTDPMDTGQKQGRGAGAGGSEEI